MSDKLREAHEMICQMCKRLNPQHTGDPDTCSCADTDFLRPAPSREAKLATCSMCGALVERVYCHACAGEDGI